MSWGQTSLGKAEINAAPTSTTEQTAMTTTSGSVTAWYQGTTTEFNGFGGKEISNKWFVKLDASGFIKIRVAKGAVVAGDILRVEVADIYQNKDNQKIGFKVEGSGATIDIQETDNAIHTLDYTIKIGDIQSEDASNDYIQINRNGQYGYNGCGYHSVEIIQSNGYKVSIDLSKFATGLPAGCDAWYTINGGTTKYRETQKVAVGTNVTYTMSSTDPHYTPAGWRTGPWGNPDNNWMGWSASFTTTIRSAAVENPANNTERVYGNVNAAPEFTLHEGNVVTFSANNNDWGSVTATVDGDPITSGSLVANGKQVQFTATPASSEYITWGWNVDGVADWHFSNPYTVTKDVTITHNFTAGIKINAYPNNGTLGSINISGDGKSGTSIHVTPYPGTVTFTATPNAGAIFEGWYSDVNFTNLITTESTLTYNDNDPADNTNILRNTGTINRWAKFTPSSSSSDIDLNFDMETNGHGSNVVSWNNGQLSVKGYNDNWVKVADLTGQGTQYTGIKLTTQGKAARIIVRYGESDNTQCIKVVDAAAKPTTIYYSWSMLGVPKDKVENLTSIRFSGANDGTYSESNPGVTTFSNVSLVNVEQASPFTTVEGNYRKFNMKDTRVDLYNASTNYQMGGNIEWTYKEEQGGDKYVTMKTTQSSYNMMEIFNKGHQIPDYNGVCIDYKGNHFRVIAKVGDDDNDKFEVTVPASATRTVRFLKWADFTKNGMPMTDADVAKLKDTGNVHIDVAGCSNHSSEESVDFYEISLHKMLSYVFYTNETHAIGQWDGNTKLTYTENIEGKEMKVVFDGITKPADRANDCKGVIINKSENDSFEIFAPAGYKVSKVRIGLGENTTGKGSFNYGNFVEINNSNQIEWTNMTETKSVRMAIPGDAANGNFHIVYITYDLESLATDKVLAITKEGSSKDRQFRVYAPNSVLSKSKIPVVISLHGGDGNMTNAVMNFDEVTNKEESDPFIVIYPNGGHYKHPVFNPDGDTQTLDAKRNWMATGDANDDIQFFKDIISQINAADQLGSETNQLKNKIDMDRIYITGFSNGGMMAYAAANCAADYFAAFSSIAGFPLEDFHLQHHGIRPVPFLHIHGTKDDYVNIRLMQTIIDNMVARNGKSYIPSDRKTISQGDAKFYGNETKYDKFVYGTYEQSENPFVYYRIGSGLNVGDTGMGHNMDCEIYEGDKWIDNKQLMWNWMKHFTKSGAADSEFLPQITATSNGGGANGNNNTARAHGWTIDEGQVIASYGESGGRGNTQGVYHSIQLEGGKNHYIKFNATNSAGGKVVTVRLTRLGDLSNFSTAAASFDITNDVVLEKSYTAGSTEANGNIVVKFDATGMTGGEYMLTFLRSNANEQTVIKNIEITKAAATETKEAEKPHTTDFGGWFSYENRLVAQWDFDLCDGPRFMASSLNGNWTRDYSQTDTGNDQAKYGTITYTYNQPIGDHANGNYAELYYDNTYRIPVSAGLKFAAPANAIKIQTEIANGVVTTTKLVLENGVHLAIPYAVNSYRSDAGTVDAPLKDKIVDGVPEKNDKGETIQEVDEDHYYEFENCMHHIKRDIIYIAAEDGDVWTHIDKYLPGTAEGDRKKETQKYNSGGDEFINGKTFNKLDYWGENNTMAVIDFTSEAKIERIAVNRNSTYSLYTQYLSKAGYDVPEPGLRVLGTGKGLKVASVSTSGGYYTDCIAITYGGWGNNDNSYESFENGNVTDSWSPLQTYNGENKTVAEVPIPSDGFYSMSLNTNPALSETLMPKDKDESFYNTYHKAWNGKFKTTYQANVTPWTLPCRGGFVKFEPTIPGVLNAHVFQSGGDTYYIADEFGNLITDNTPNASMYHKTGTAQTILGDGTNGYSVANSDYVKYSFNVYPGKSYYIFSNTKGLGFMGAFFEPFVCRVQQYDNEHHKLPLSELDRGDLELATLTLDDSKTYALVESGDGANLIYPDGAGDNPDGAPGVKTRTIYSPKAPNGTVTPKDDTDFTDPTKWQAYQIHSSKQAVEATVNRSFVKDTWNSICLPFSMNHLMLENVFGKGTSVILLRDVQPAERSSNGLTTANFIYHENQDIIAGYPYLICPTQNVSSIKCNVSLYDIAPTIPTVSGEGFNTTTGEGNYSGLSYYEFGGTFAPTTIPQYSYVMSTKGNLSRQTKEAGVNVKAYRAYLKYIKENDPTSAQAKSLQFISFGGVDVVEDAATDIEQVEIEDVLFNAGILSKPADVYNMSGVKIRSNVKDLRSLPKGAYIVNNKKYIVR